MAMRTLSSTPTIAIFMLLLLTSWESSMATTLVVSNQLVRPHGIVYVRCEGNWAYEMSKLIPAGSKTSIVVPPNADGTNWPPVVCVGKYSEVSSYRHILYTSTLSGDNKGCKNDRCLVKVTDDGFYRWNEEKKSWDLIPSKIWLP